MKRLFIIPILLALLTVSGCVTFKSDLKGAFPDETRPHFNADPVSVVFVFSHVRQTTGMDVVPKLVDKRMNIPGFDDIFQDALGELTNVRQYATYTRSADDVNKPRNRARLDSLLTTHDFTIETRIVARKSFAKYFLGVIGSTLTVTLLPVPYTQTYELESRVFDREHKLVATYTRGADLTKWVQTLMLFGYPFYPEEREREKIYVEFLHDVFRQIESEGVLHP